MTETARRFSLIAILLGTLATVPASSAESMGGIGGPSVTFDATGPEPAAASPAVAPRRSAIAHGLAFRGRTGAIMLQNRRTSNEGWAGSRCGGRGVAKASPTRLNLLGNTRAQPPARGLWFVRRGVRFHHSLTAANRLLAFPPKT